MQKMKLMFLSIFVFITGYTVHAQTDQLSKIKTFDSHIESTNIEWAFTEAKQRPEKLLISEIESAQISLDIAIYSLTHPDIVQAIKDAKKRGVSVRVITDKQQAGGKSQTEALKVLGSAEIPLKINKHSGLMHHKMTIIDGKSVTIGSFNYSKAASTTNDEVLMVIREESIAMSFSAQFENLWNDELKVETVKKWIAMPEEGVAHSKNPAENFEADFSVESEPATSCDNPHIKGNRNSNIYHVPGGMAYESTTANIELFCTEADAEAAGYRKSQR